VRKKKEEQRKKSKNRAKTEKNPEQNRAKKFTQRGESVLHCFHPCKKQPKQNQYPQKPAPSFISFIIPKSAKKKTKADRGHRSKKGKQKERYQAGKSHQQPFQPELRHRLQRL